MTRRQIDRPLKPLYDVETRYGSLVVGSTPGVPPPNYDDVIADMGLMWYCKGEVLSAPDWPTLLEALAEDIANEAVRGRIYFEHWYAESGYAPASYEVAITTYYDLIWYSTVDSTVAPTWPSLAVVMAGDLANEANEGRIWFEAWYAESGNAPATYATAVDENDPIWFCPADELI